MMLVVIGMRESTPNTLRCFAWGRLLSISFIPAGSTWCGGQTPTMAACPDRSCA
jgi:hypothetical protein